MLSTKLLVSTGFLILAPLLANCTQPMTGRPATGEATAPSRTFKREAQEPRRGGILNVSGRLKPEHWDVHQAASSATLWPVGPVYSSLLRYDWVDNEKIIPDLAEKWTVSEQGDLYTFSLRRGVKWQDGTSMTAADVKFSLDRVRTPPQGVTSPRKALLGTLRIFRRLTTLR